MASPITREQRELQKQQQEIERQATDQPDTAPTTDNPVLTQMKVMMEMMTDMKADISSINTRLELVEDKSRPITPTPLAPQQQSKQPSHSSQ